MEGGNRDRGRERKEKELSRKFRGKRGENVPGASLGVTHLC